MIDDVVNRFRDLRRLYGHAPTGRRSLRAEHDHDINMYKLAQLEMYNLAQVICHFHDHDLQRRLDLTRRAIMDEFKHQIDLSRTENFPGSLMVITKKYRPSRWEDYILTPELTFSPQITGLAVPQRLVDELKKAHRAQVQLVTKLTMPGSTVPKI